MKSILVAIRKPAFCGLTVLAGAASAQHPPLVKNGACPQLTREAAAWINTPEAKDRFLNNNSQNLTLRANPGTIQSALAPQASVNCSQTPSGFRAEMWASELDAGNIKAVQSFTFDERGRMWAVETFDYPNTITGPFAGHDRIIILEDSDGDKVVDKQSVFVTGLNIVQSIEIVPQGVVVGMSPHIVLFEDKNGDDKADNVQGRTLYTGFGKGDTHGSIQGSLRYGVDNWVYGDNGYNGGNVNGVNFGAGIFRFRTDSTKFEFVSGVQGGNSCGLGMMEDGQVFSSGATGGGNTHTQASVLPSVQTPTIAAYGNEIKALTQDLVQGDQQNGFTAATGPEIYTARLFPQAYWNRASFVNEGTGHLTNVDFLTPNKSTWTATRNAATPNIFASTDAWTAPLYSKVGPDGALWVLDWYTYVLLHNGMGCCNGPGDGWDNPLRTRTRNRIYRVVPDNGQVDPVLNLSTAGFPELVAALGNSNMFWRTSAQRMIIRKATTPALKTEVEALLEPAVKSRQRDAVGIDGRALHALWTAQGLGLFASNAAKWDPILKELLLHPAPAVRMNAVRAMPATAASIQSIKDACIVNDDDPYVRLWTLLAMAKMPALGGISMFSTFHNLDTYSTQAFTRAAAGSGVTDAGTRPCTPALNPVGVAPGLPATAGWNLRFVPARAGWNVVPDASLGRGELTLYDVRGTAVDRIVFDGYRWSRPLRAGAASVYHYVYRGLGGVSLRGRLTPTMAP